MVSFSLNLSKVSLILLTAGITIGCQPAYYTQQNVDTNNIEINDDFKPDSVITSQIAPFKAQLDEKMNLVIGEAEISLDNKPGTGESLLGNFVADLLLERAKSKYGKEIDMAIINSHGGLRTSINKGAIEVKEIFELMPFENTMIILELDGNLTQQFFNRCAASKRNNVAGARFVIKDSRPSNIIINEKAFDNSRTYTIAISDYLAAGGGGFHFLKEAKIIHDLEYKTRDMIIDQIKLLTEKGQKVTAEWDQRIQIIN